MEKVSLTFDDFENLLNTNIKIRFENNITLDSELIELEKLPKYSEFSGQPFYFILPT